MGDSAFWNSFWISIKRVVIGTIWTMVVLIMMSYPLAKSKTEYKPRNVLMWILVFCMLFNGGTIPWFITVKNYGMIDTMAALVLAGSVPVFNVLLMMNFFRGIPGDLEEAARVDGAGPWRILWQIVVPCSKPVYRNHRPVYIRWLLERVFPGPGINEQRDELSVTDLHPSDLRSDPGRRNPDCRAVSAVSTELQQITGGSKGIYRPCSYADCISVPAEILRNRYYTGSSKRIRENAEKAASESKQEAALFCAFFLASGEKTA